MKKLKIILGKLSYLFLWLSLLAPITIFGCKRINAGKVFDANCTVYLNTNSDNTQEIISNIDICIKYLEKNNLNNGFTSISEISLNDSLALFYSKLIQTENMFKEADSKSSEIEKEYYLNKAKKNMPSPPGGISIYPNNVSYFWFLNISIILAAVWLVIGVVIIAS